MGYSMLKTYYKRPRGVQFNHIPGVFTLASHQAGFNTRSNLHLGDKGAHNFTRGISLKMNVLAELDSEVEDYHVTVQHGNH